VTKNAPVEARVEARAHSIRRVRQAVELLSGASEEMRERIDNLEKELNDLGASGPISEEKFIYKRLLDIRRLRNSMECFALKCRVLESMDKAWKELP
jgi:hypothetical protein